MRFGDHLVIIWLHWYDEGPIFVSLAKRRGRESQAFLLERGNLSLKTHTDYLRFLLTQAALHGSAYWHTDTQKRSNLARIYWHTDTQKRSNLARIQANKHQSLSQNLCSHWPEINKIPNSGQSTEIRGFLSTHARISAY